MTLEAVRKRAPLTAEQIIDRLISVSEDKIWATELALPPWRERRIDFWTLEPIASKGFRATTYEVKVTRADFLRDSQEKQSSAISYSDRFWYITPPDLISTGELPPWAGLMECMDVGFSVKKRAPKLSKREPDWEFVVSVIRNCGRTRRDTSFITSQLAYLQAADRRRNERNRHQMEWQNKRWLRRVAAQETALSHTTPEQGEAGK